MDSMLRGLDSLLVDHPMLQACPLHHRLKTGYSLRVLRRCHLNAMVRPPQPPSLCLYSHSSPPHGDTPILTLMFLLLQAVAGYSIRLVDA